MDSKDIVHLGKTFAAQVMALRQAAWAQSTCRMNINVLYGLPDHPLIAQEFIHQTDDVFTPGADVAAGVMTYEEKMKAAKTVHAMMAVYEAWCDFYKKSDTFLNESEKLSRPMRLVFNAATPTQQADMIARSVRFPKTRDFLLFWTRKIEGPLREVTLDPAMLFGVTQGRCIEHANHYGLN